MTWPIDRKKAWAYGWAIPSQIDCLTNLRFADDVLLFATSLAQLQRMLCDFKRRTEKVEVTISDIKVEVLLVQECATYLGQTITFQQ